MDREQIYWDSDAFLGLLNDEADKAKDCSNVLQAARSGTVQIVTSALTLAEVLYIKGQKKLDAKKRGKVDAFFKSDFISVRNVTRLTSELARDLVWDKNIRPKDAIHVATACLYRVPVLHTFDQKLIDSSGLALAGHTLKICKPAIIHQVDWVETDNEQPEQTDRESRAGSSSSAPDAGDAANPTQKAEVEKGKVEKGKIEPKKP